MSGIDEIISSGRPPAFGGINKDPNCADIAVPRAFKQLEQTMDAKKIVKQMGFKPTKHNLNEIRRTWNI